MERKEVIQYLQGQIWDRFGCTFNLDDEQLKRHIPMYFQEWTEIVLFAGEEDLLAGEHLSDNLLLRVLTLNDIIDAFMEVIDNKTRLVAVS
jgi:hypothetical protein